LRGGRAGAEEVRQREAAEQAEAADAEEFTPRNALAMPRISGIGDRQHRFVSSSWRSAGAAAAN
jgi:hypothetical protein